MAPEADKRFPVKLAAFFVALSAVAIVGAVITSTQFGSASSLGTLTVTNSVQVQENDPAVAPIVAQVQDLFPGGNANLNGLTTTFDPGSGTFGTPAPTWSAVRSGAAAAANTWQRRSGGGGHARRRKGGTGPNFSMALIPWLTRTSTASMTFTRVDIAGADRTYAGLVLNSNAIGSAGIAAVVECNGACVGHLEQITGNNSSSVCAGPTPVLRAANKAAVTITNFTNNPGAAGNDVTATFTQTGGTGAKTLTCEPSSTQNGGYSGMFSAFGSNNTRFGSVLFSYS